jgi:protein TorT
MNKLGKILYLTTGLMMAGALPAAQANDNAWFPAKVEVWNPPFNMASPRTPMDYVPIKATKKWNICVSVPHMKDAYWVAVNYGVVEEAKRQGVKLTVYEAGGYTNLNKQISQIEDCMVNGGQAIIAGAISSDGLNNVVKAAAKQGIPFIDFMNGMNSPDIAAKSLVSFREMGAGTGFYLSKRHAKGSGKIKVAWFPGPAGAGWVEAGNQGFVAAIQGSDVEIVETKYGDTGKEVQLKLVEDVLQSSPNIDYIVGTSPTAEAAAQALRIRGLSDKIKVLSYYITPTAYDNIKKKTILAAPTDSPVIQARVAVDQAVRILEKREYSKHVGPKLFVVDANNIDKFDRATAFAPDDFKPVFTVK